MGVHLYRPGKQGLSLTPISQEDDTTESMFTTP